MTSTKLYRMTVAAAAATLALAGGPGAWAQSGTSGGASGSAGTTGSAGTGSTGSTGTAGTPGSTGSGTAGTTGSTGTTGTAGTTGTGATGSTGSTGSAGAVSSTGSTGTTGSTGSASATGSSGSGTAATGSSGTARSGTQTGAASQLDRGDRQMIEDLAQANMAEVETGRLALEKSQNAEVKKFAQHMIDDHTKALGEVQALATAKNVKLPDGPGPVAKTKATALKAMSGNLFDKEYAKRAGVGDHESTVKLLQKIQKNAKDSDLKALASKMLPTVEHHLDTAKSLASSSTSAAAKS